MKRAFASVIAGVMAVSAHGAQAKPLKVYILAGQSNMEGQAKVETFDYIGDDPKTAPILSMMRGTDGKPAVCDNVWISYLTGANDKNFTLAGKLTAGYGSMWGQDTTKPGDKIGPEFTFGLTLEKACGGPILIIKTAWGGKSLNTDFRPPSAGPFELPARTAELWAKNPQGAHGIPKAEDRPKWHAEKTEKTGVYYRLMIEHVKKVLADPKRVCPAYDPKAGYELAGFVWFQGWNDMCDSTTYPESHKPGGYAEYTRLMAHFIRDVRKELSAPKMPFVIGVMGVEGEKATGGLANIRAAMAAPAEMPEFKGHVVAVPTAPFWDEPLAAIDDKRGKVRQMGYFLDSKHKDHANKDGKMTKEEQQAYLKAFQAKLITPEDEALWNRGASNAGYHYLGCAKTLALSGKAFAEALLEMPGEFFEVDGRPAFVILPAVENRLTGRPTPWVWYAPTFPNLPGAEERWMFERFLTNGIAIAGIDVGESYGSPTGRAHFTALYRQLVERRNFSRKPCLLARSRGGLMLYNWAAEHPEAVSGIAGIYPVCNLRSYPGLKKACGAYGLTEAELEAQLVRNNPIDRLAPLAKAGVPIFHIHGDSDKLVPLSDNSAIVAERYRELGGSMRMRIPPGQGHNMWKGFFQCEELVEFVIAKASPAAEREPSSALFMNPPIEARPGAFWDWMNGDVDLDRLTFELEEMKAKGMSGAEIWDIGVIRILPDELIPAGPAFLGPESLKAVNHAIEQADRLGLHLGIVASSSWNAGGSWVKPDQAMKGIYHSDITVQGPASLSQLLPFPVVPRAPKGEDGLPLYYREIAVLAFPEVKSNTIADVSSVINISAKMDAKGRLTWEVPAGTWVIQRFVNSMTGEKLKVPSPNSNGLLIDHLDAAAARSHFLHIIDQILTMRPSLDAMRYMEVDSVEIGRDTSQDWTESFVEEFRKRRGYDPIPYLPALKGKSFSDALLTARFRQDYRKTVSDLWIDGHYRASTKVLNTYGMQLVAEGGHGGYPRVEPLKAMGVVDIPRGEFWNGKQFWVVKEAASAAHIYGLQLVDSESFTGWRSWQDGPLEYKRLADTAFCDGLNRITFHTFAHTPPHGGVPGNMYHAGEHFNVNATWWNQSGPMLAYFSRCCYLLQQGLPVGDVCYYYGDVAPNLVATRRIGPDSTRLDGDTCAHCGRPNPAPVDALGSGYDYDVIDSEVIRERLEVKEGRLVLPHGVSYAALVLPSNEEMPLPVLEKLERLVREGATVLGPRPTRTPSLADHSNSDEKVREIAGRLWGAVADAPPQEKVVGKGRVIPDRKRIREVLLGQGLGPDFAYTSPGAPADLDYIHRRTLNSDIYFVSNTQMAYAEAECTFRVHGRKPRFWHPDTGEIAPCTGYTRVAGGMKLRVRLPPAGSVFVVFSGAVSEDLPEPLVKPVKPLQPHELTGPWEVRFPPNRGAPASCVFEKLVSWTEMPDDGIKYFSGTATYVKSFEVSEAWLKGGRRIELSLGELRNVAEVTVNGKPLGILWKPPYTVDVTGLLKPGKNELKIDITNLWANRLVGDAKLPREKRVTRITQKVPVGGPHESGLFGPVRLLNVPCPAQEVTVGKEWKSQPPAGCPFEASDVVTGVFFTGKNKTYTRADTWYPSWASDDRMYSPFTDGSVYLPLADGKTTRVFSGSGYNLEKLKSPVTGFAVIEGNDPTDLKITRAGLIPNQPFPYGGQYPCGSLAYNGVWYHGTYCLDWHKKPWDIMGPFVGFNISKDFGQSWLSDQRTALNPLFGESAKDGRAVMMYKMKEKYEKSEYSKGKAGAKVKIGAPHFVDFGKNMEHSPDGHAYMVAHGATRPDSYNTWAAGDQAYLLRVKPSPETMNDPSAWEFYGGKDDKGNAVWTADFQKIKPLLEWNDHMGIVTATYVPGLKRYIMCVTDGRGPKADGVGPYDTYLLESRDLTGPWKLASYMKAFGEEAYFVNVPSKFIAADGKTLWLSYSHGWSHKTENPPGGKYAWCLQEVKLLTPTNTPLSPGLRSAP